MADVQNPEPWPHAEFLNSPSLVTFTMWDAAGLTQCGLEVLPYYLLEKIIAPFISIS